MQALEEVENESIDNWNRSGALAWLASRQRADGSFEADVGLTAEVVLGLAPRGVASIRMLDCGQGLTDSPPPKILTTNGELGFPAVHERLVIIISMNCYNSYSFWYKVLVK